MIDSNRQVVFCECGDTRDHIVLTPDEDNMLVIDVLSAEKSFFRRFKTAFNYVFMNDNNGLFSILVDKTNFKETINKL